MKEIIAFLQKNPVQYLSTIGLDNRPKVRPFQFMLEESGKLYFCTSNEKNVYQELQKNPYVEFCSCGENFSWIRLNAKVIFVKNLEIKKKIQDLSPLVKSIYQTPENPNFEIFYLEEASAIISDFSGNPPKKFVF